MIFKRIFIVFLLIILVLSVGVIGYMTLEDLSFLDALYMSVITISTVGYKEVKELSITGKWFTIAMIIGGISVITVAFAMFSTLILEGEVGYYIRRRQMEKKIKSLKGHILICGLGELGEEVVRNLKNINKKFVVIENSHDEIERMLKVIGEFLYITGDATDLNILESANIKNAATLITCVGSDSQNLFVVITAREANPGLTIVTEAIDRNVKEKLRRAGGDYIISPSQIGGLRMASVATKPNIVSFLDVITTGGEKDLHVESILINEKSPVVSKVLAEAQIPKKTGLIIISIKKKESGQFIYNPSSQTRLDPGDEIMVLGLPENLEKLKGYLG